MTFPVDLSLLQNVTHMPALPVLQRSMNRPDLRLHDFCIPVNPYFPTRDVIDELKTHLSDILRYYPSGNQTVAGLLEEVLGISAENIVVANGSTELITWIHQRFITKDVVTDVPTFGRWTDNPRELNRKVHCYFRQKSNEFRIEIDDLVRYANKREARAIAICNPNNPTGAFTDPTEIRRLLDAMTHLDVVVVDESFVDFAAEESIPTVANDVVERENVIVIKSLGKNFGLHGLRCGYAITNAKMAADLRRMLPPWNVNTLAEELIRAMSRHTAEYESGRRQVVRDSKALERRLAQVDALTPFASNANFVFAELDAEIPGEQLRNTLLCQTGCFIRECGSKIGSGPQFLRIATRPVDEQQLLITSLNHTIDRIRNSPAKMPSALGAA